MGPLSEQDRQRLAELLRAPLLPPPEPPEKRFAWRWLPWARGALAVVLCLIAAGIAIHGYWYSRGSEPISLQALEQAGQLQIRWNPAAGPIRRALGARLDITDGAERIFVRLDPARLQRGSVRYARRTEKVDLHMAVTQPGGKVIEGHAHFSGSRPYPQTEQLALRSERAGTPAATEPIAGRNRDRTAPRKVRPKPAANSGKTLPFTCSVGQTFVKTDAPPGWNQFGCAARNVWVLVTSSGRGRQARIPQS